VLDQPDSPIEILSVNLEGMWISVSNGRYTYRNCSRYQVRNRSDQVVRHFEIGFNINEGSGFYLSSSQPIASGGTIELKACNGGGDGDAPQNSVKLLVSVHWIDFGDCMYRPSVRIPRNLGVHPASISWN
jgi:hypothetical protein